MDEPIPMIAFMLLALIGVFIVWGVQTKTNNSDNVELESQGQVPAKLKLYDVKPSKLKKKDAELAKIN